MDRNVIEIHPRDIADTKREIYLNKPELPSGQIRICFFSDVHCCVNHGEPDRIMEILRQEEPDLVCCGGDNLIAKGEYDPAPVADFLNEIGGVYRLFLAHGNHETRLRAGERKGGREIYDDFLSRLNTEKVTLLDNDDAVLEVGGLPVRIFGFTMKAQYYRRVGGPKLPPVEIREAVGVPDPSEISILLAHSPSGMPAYFRWGADLTLCGHYHGGIFRMGEHTGAVTPDLKIFSGEAYGQFEKDGHHVIVTSGAGEHSLPVRINNPREVVSVTIWQTGKCGS